MKEKKTEMGKSKRLDVDKKKIVCARRSCVVSEIEIES